MAQRAPESKLIFQTERRTSTFLVSKTTRHPECFLNKLQGMVWYAVYGRNSRLEAPSALPAISIPIGPTTYYNMPAGLQLIARSCDDGLLLSVAAALQPLFKQNAPPPAMPLCFGCTPKAIASKVDELVAATPSEDVVLPATVQYKLDMEGSCKLKDSLSFPMVPPEGALNLAPPHAEVKGWGQMNQRKECTADI